MRVVASVRGCLSSASGRLTDQISWNSSCTPRLTRKALAAPSKLRKGTASPYAAAIHLWLGYSALNRAARVPLQPSNCCSHLVIPPQSRNGDCPRNADFDY